jgi:hypothetical protein
MDPASPVRQAQGYEGQARSIFFATRDHKELRAENWISGLCLASAPWALCDLLWLKISNKASPLNY